MGQTLQLTLSVLCTGYDSGTVRHAVDLFLLLFYSLEDFQKSFVQYPQSKNCLQKVFTRINEVDGQIVAKIFEFANALCSVPESASQLVAVLFTEGVKRPSLMSIFNFLKEKEVVFAKAVTLGLKLIDSIIKLPRVSDIMCEDLSITDNIINMLLTCVGQTNYSSGEETMSILINKQVDALTILLELVNMNFCLKSVQNRLIVVLESLIQDQFVHNPILKRQCKNKWSTSGISCSIIALSVLLKVTSKGKSKQSSSSTTFWQDERLFYLLSFALRGTDKTDISLSLSILYQLMSTSAILDSFSDVHALSNEHTVSDEIELNNATAIFKRDSSLMNTSISVNNLERIDTKQIDLLIDKFRSETKIKDCRASEIMSVYEHKILSLNAKENHLHDLINAKSQAMLQADRLLNQYRSKMTLCESEVILIILHFCNEHSNIKIIRIKLYLSLLSI
jgi:hypothetical protein